MKRSILLLIAVSFMASVFGFDFSVNGIFYKIKTPLSANKVAVTTGSETGNSYSGDLVIPSSVTYNAQTYSVTEIGAWAFMSSSSLSSVVIPTSIDTIGDGIFWGCRNMTTINLPASVKKIGNYVFVGCFGLTNINIDDANTVFKSFQGVLYNKSMNQLRAYPAGKPALSYTIASTVDSVMTSAFSNAQLTSLIIPNTVRFMEHAAIILCDGLTEVTLPALYELNNNPFYYCKNMVAVNVDPASSYLESVDGILFKKGLQTIIYYPPAKAGTSYVIPSTVNYIRSGVFMNCLGLTSVTIPSSVNVIRGNVFEGCSNLATINSYLSTPIDFTTSIDGESKDVFKGVDTLHCVLHVPVGSRSLYANAFQWKGFSNIVEGFTAGFTSAKTSNLKASTFKRSIILSGYRPEELITVYNVQGTILYRQPATSTSTTINLNNNGVVLVKVGTSIVKVILF